MVIPIAVIARLLAEQGLFFGGVNPVPVRVNPLLFLLSAVTGLGTTLAAWLRWPARWAKRPFWPFFIASLFAVSFAGLISSAYPGAGAIVSRDTITLDGPPAPRGTSFAIPILFANNSAVLSRPERDRLRENFEVYRGCEAGNLKVRGFASSAPFREFSDHKNKTLANERAKAVSEAVVDLTGVMPIVVVWESYEEMERNRRIRDVDVEGSGRILAAEARNRRAELFWDDTTCFSPRPVDATVPAAAP